MPAQSRAQQQAAGIALAAKRGDIPKSKLKGASASMAKMGSGELKKFAKTKSGGLPKHVKEARANRIVSTLLEDEGQSDYDRYVALQAQMKQMGAAQMHTPEFREVWRQAEAIKNRNGGMPPKPSQPTAPPKASFAPNPGYAA